MKKIKKPRQPILLRWAGYVNFAVFWFGIGYLVQILIEETMFRPYISSTCHILNFVVVPIWAFNLFRTYRWADLRNARKLNKHFKNMLDKLYRNGI